MNGSPAIGVISDTHGLLRPEALQALAGSSLILHAGDIGRPEVIAELERLAPVIAVRGNVDTGAWADAFPETRTEQVGGCRIHLLHDRKQLAVEPAGLDVVVAGHSHQPLNEVRDGVLHFNPGSAGPRRFRLPVAVGRLWCRDGKVEGEIVELAV